MQATDYRPQTTAYRPRAERSETPRGNGRQTADHSLRSPVSRLPSPVSRLAAFTLIELLAAIAILTILMTIVFSVYNQVSKAWTLGEQRTETFQNARLALDMMGRELETAIAASNTVTRQKITFLSLPNANSVPADPGGGQLYPTQPNDQLFFVGANSDSAGQPYFDLTEYGYFVVYAQLNCQTMRSNAFYLVRHMARTHDSGGSVNAYFDVFSNPTAWYNTPGYSTSTKTPLLDNVLRLWIMFEGSDTGNAVNGTTVCRGWVNSAVIDATGCNWAQPSALSPSVASPEITLPRAVHIRLAVIDRRGATRLGAYIKAKNWTGTTAGSLNGDLGEIIPNCNNQDLTTIGTSSAGGANADPVLQNLLLGSVHYFYKTVYLRNCSNDNSPRLIP